MKTTFKSILLALLGVFAFTCCEDVPAPYEVIFNDDNPYGAVTGAYPFYQNGETETSPKGLVPLQDGDRLVFVCDYYGYDGSYQSSHTLGTELTVSGKLTLENLSVENNLVPSYRITDIYGNHYWIAF